MSGERRRRFAVLGSSVSTSGTRMLILPDDNVVQVEAFATDEELKVRYAVDAIVRAAAVDVSVGIFLDGPLAGTHAYVSPNEIGARHVFRLAQVDGGRRGWYTVTRIAVDDQPAELRFAGFIDDPT